MPCRTTKVVALVGVVFFAIAGAASCSSSSNETPVVVDSGGAAEAEAAAPVEAASDAPVEAEATVTCNLGTQPTMPAITSEIVIQGVDGGANAPTATGGDEAGLWLYTQITLYLPATADGQVDTAESKIDGKGFIDLGAGKFRQFVDTTTVLSTSVVGKVTRAGSTKATGTYVKTDATAKLTIECRESTGETNTLGDVGFSRVDPTHAKLHLTTTGALGTATLVVDLEKAP